ncbi:MAG: tRNA pseudouridine(13) synthase TruD [Halieaceae bacterium]|jgi:tRNA pseudouridine13 synthase|nr:tRNA pseudouridine(13) synthase TruD [Halieaceae bacterium]
MTTDWPRAWGEPAASARFRSSPEDFRVSEELGFELSGEGEHVFLFLQKRELNSLDLLQRLAALSGVPERDIGLSGLKDRNAVTRQWFSVGMAGRREPDWQALEADGDVQLLQQGRHSRKLRRGVHRANRFSLVLRDIRGDRADLERRLQLVREQGAPNYFGEQRFGRNGATLEQACRWARGGRRRQTRARRSLYLSALRAFLFNTALASRVTAGDWNSIGNGDVCMLNGTRSLFPCGPVDAALRARGASGDVHPGLPLWGRGESPASPERALQQWESLAEHRDLCEFLESEGLELSWRPTRLVADDFCWQFCDDGGLQLDFALGAGAYATALLAEVVQYEQGTHEGT